MEASPRAAFVRTNLFPQLIKLIIRNAEANQESKRHFSVAKAPSPNLVFAK
jgi:phenylalanyl-tRNA synthetase beta subunit